MNIRASLISGLAFVVFAAPALADEAKGISEKEALRIGTEAYVYGYPLVTMEVTRQRLTHVAAPEGLRGAPTNQLSHVRSFLTAGFTEVVAPNNDTLYSQAWLDLAKEPVVLHLPDAKGRYYLMPILSGWTDVVASPGTRTTGDGAGDYAIVGPDFHGALPAGVRELRSPTNMAWLLGRVYSTGTPTDLAAVHAFQDGLSLTPLSAYGRPYSPPQGQVDPGLDRKTSPKDLVDRMDAATFFKILAAKLQDNPPAAADAPMVADLARVGIQRGRAFDLRKLTPSVARALTRSVWMGQQRIRAHAKSAGKRVNGWTWATKIGRYGTDYLQRALVTSVGLGANLPLDAIYPVAKVDSQGERLNGAGRYVIHFAPGATPPVKAFWSVTMYDDRKFFVKNSIDRYAIHSADKLTFNKDGSLDLYLQHSSPGRKAASNWLPAPMGDFDLVLRMYWPTERALRGAWEPPPVVRSR